jgi:hypothetical protein
MASHERIARALNSSNLKQDEQHFDADVVAALAFAPQLGASIHALVLAGHQEEAPRTIRLLTQTLIRAGRRKRIGFGSQRAEVVARQALLEWVIRVCRACNGSGRRLVSYSHDAEQPTQEDSCSHCEGTGVFTPTWAWRHASMELPPEAEQGWWEKRLDLAKEIMDDAFRSTRRKVTSQLED